MDPLAPIVLSISVAVLLGISLHSSRGQPPKEFGKKPRHQCPESCFETVLQTGVFLGMSLRCSLEGGFIGRAESGSSVAKLGQGVGEVCFLRLYHVVELFCLGLSLLVVLLAQSVTFALELLLEIFRELLIFRLKSFLVLFNLQLKFIFYLDLVPYYQFMTLLR